MAILWTSRHRCGRHQDCRISGVWRARLHFDTILLQVVFKAVQRDELSDVSGRELRGCTSGAWDARGDFDAQVAKGTWETRITALEDWGTLGRTLAGWLCCGLEGLEAQERVPHATRLFPPSDFVLEAKASR